MVLHELECGCTYETTKGGTQTKTCKNNPLKREEIDKCSKAHKKWIRSKKYYEFLKEIQKTR